MRNEKLTNKRHTPNKSLDVLTLGVAYMALAREDANITRARGQEYIDKGAKIKFRDKFKKAGIERC
jgi:hypothetical protein